MFYYAPRRNGVAYLFWRRLLRNNGSFTAWLDAFFFGPGRGMNDYNSLAATYKKSNAKPDKQYSILPTVLGLVGDCTGKAVTDIGCGAGFFTIPLAEAGAQLVYGLDNSQAQIKLAEKISPHPAINYFVRDAFVDALPPSDIVVAPFVTNYARTMPMLKHFFHQLHDCLRRNGKAVLVIDLPNGKNLRRFGAMKSFTGPGTDGAEIHISLFKDEAHICTLNAVYYTPETVERLLHEVGFTQVRWTKPIVSQEGMRLLGAEFWKGYTDDPELGYLVAEK